MSAGPRADGGRTAPLRVALDGRPLQDRPLGGVGRYLANVVPYLAEAVDVVLLVDSRRRLPDASRTAGTAVVPLWAPPGAPSLGWLELAAAPWLAGFDGVFHGTFYALPLRFAGKGVLMLHDLAPQVHPQDFGAVKRAAWRFYARASVRKARQIVTVSEFIRGQILDRFPAARERVQVAPCAVDPVFDPGRAGQARGLARSLGVEGRYVVALGGARRRGLTVAIEAWRRVRRQLGGEPALVVVGEDHVGPEPGLVAPGRLDDAAWATLLAGAQALCYPTRYEGFGLPALEAAASGTPVVCAPVASLPEVLDDAACWCAAPTPDAVAATLARLLSEPEWHRQRREAGLAVARKAPTWRDSASVLVEAYERSAR